MKRIMFLSILLLASTTMTAFAVDTPLNEVSQPPVENLSQYIYSYGTVLKVSSSELVLQEYDYDSDVEKEVSYQIDASLKLEGITAVTDLVTEDVIEIYYLEQDGKKIAKIIRKELMEDESLISKGPAEDQ